MAVLAPASAFAGQKEDEYSKAMAAMNGGRVDEAARYFCAIAQQDPNYKDVKINCKIMGDQAKREDARNDERWNNAQKALNSGDYDTAEQELKNIKSGPHRSEAQAKLAQIPQLRAEKDRQKGEAAMQAKFDQAMSAYNANNFSSAQALFSQITGSHAGDAQAYINRINKYNQAMTEGDTLAAAKNLQGALNAYNDAANIKGDGPGDPRGKAGRMQQLMAANTPPPQPVQTPTPQVTPQRNPEPVRQPVVAAVKQSAEPKVDVSKLLKEAEAAKAKGDIGLARVKYKTLLSLDPSNSQAMRELAALPTESAPPTQKAGSEADVILAKGITEFYQGDFQTAEVHIKDYLDVNGAKSALGYFYLGVSKLTRYYLGGEQASDKKLMNDAQAAFRIAKKSDGFRPPKSLISPKIMKVYETI